MKKIIKEGVLLPVEYQIDCGKCTTIFTYNPSDIESDRDGNYVTCPKCGAFIASSLGKKVN